jgi:hypothetical protein
MEVEERLTFPAHTKRPASRRVKKEEGLTMGPSFFHSINAAVSACILPSTDAAADNMGNDEGNGERTDDKDEDEGKYAKVDIRADDTHKDGLHTGESRIGHIARRAAARQDTAVPAAKFDRFRLAL